MDYATQHGSLQHSTTCQSVAASYMTFWIRFSFIFLAPFLLNDSCQSARMASNLNFQWYMNGKRTPASINSRRVLTPESQRSVSSWKHRCSFMTWPMLQNRFDALEQVRCCGTVQDLWSLQTTGLRTPRRCKPIVYVHSSLQLRG